MSPVVILGCGYTGRRVALRLIRRGVPVIGLKWTPDMSFVRPGARVLYSLPPFEGDRMEEVIAQLASRAARMVYISTTGVYGAALEVDHSTPAAPADEKNWVRSAKEGLVMNSGCSAMVLRPAGIYGRDRGVHISMLEGRYRMNGDGSNYVSRIHVDDLAAHCEAALFSSVEGAWPVADEHPCTSLEIAEYCARLLNLPLPPAGGRMATRKVDGSAVRKALGITLAYPSYREGLAGIFPARSIG